MIETISIAEQRKLTKQRHELYREAARRITGGHVSNVATPVENIDGTGAFVEVVIWVPNSEIQAEPEE